MQSVTCERWLAYTPQKIYETLTEPDQLAHVVKRLQSIEILDRQQETADVQVVIDLPGGKEFRTLGHVEGIPAEQLAFKTDSPVRLHITWELAPVAQDGISGTQVTYRVEVDFAPVAAFISKVMLQGYLSSEMQRDLDTLEKLMQTASSPA